MRHSRSTNGSPVDALREFLYLDETSVVSLLAALQGAIPDTVTENFGRSRDWGLTANAGPKASLSAGGRVGGGSHSATETMRKAVAQSTFRELWRLDSGVVLHDIERFPSDLGVPMRTLDELAARIDWLVQERAAVALDDLRRGSIVEVGWRVQADQAYRTLTAARTMFDLMSGRESLFAVEASELAAVGPMLEVLSEFTTGTVPIRGRCTSHFLFEVGDSTYMVDARIIDPEGMLPASANEVEFVSLADASGFWRDPVTSLVDGFDCIGYLRLTADGIVSSREWNPMRLADVLGALGPQMRDATISALDFLRQPGIGAAAGSGDSDALGIVAALVDLAMDAQGGAGNAPSADVLLRAAADLGAAPSVTERRRVMDEVLETTLGEGVLDRETVRSLRDRAVELGTAGGAPSQTEPAGVMASPAVPWLEAATIALYW